MLNVAAGQPAGSLWHSGLPIWAAWVIGMRATVKDASLGSISVVPTSEVLGLLSFALDAVFSSCMCAFHHPDVLFSGMTSSLSLTLTTAVDSRFVQAEWSEWWKCTLSVPDARHPRCRQGYASSEEGNAESLLVSSVSGASVYLLDHTL